MMKLEEEDSERQIGVSGAQELNLIFRNQHNEDTSLKINTAQVQTIEKVKEELDKHLNINQEKDEVKLFFKGRPLKNEEQVSKISIKFLNFIRTN